MGQKNFPFGQKIVWQPEMDVIQKSNLMQFMHKYQIRDYDDLYLRSVNDIAWFWDAVMQDLDIRFYQNYSKIIDTSDGIQFPKWCVGGKMNIIHNMLDKWQKTDTADRIALIFEAENEDRHEYSYQRLYQDVNKCANGLRQLGITKGDVVGLFMPMIPELAIAFLSVIKIGAIILPLFSGYGPQAIQTRLTDGGAKVLITADGFSRRDKKVFMKSVADEAVSGCDTIKNMIVVNRIDVDSIPWQQKRDIWWHELLKNQSIESETEKTSAEDVLMLIYTSGTTGKPKGAVHTHCGFPVKAAQDMFHAMDMKPENTMYWMTDMGWMMGPWEVFGTLLIGASMVFYEGAPDYPDVDRTWRLVEKYNISHLGLSPTLIRSLKTYGEDPVKKHNLDSLRAVCSTGSPWDTESWLWLFNTVLNGEKPILNYSGGTEISGGIVCGNFFKPLKPCAFSGPVPGMAADVVDEKGDSISGEVGELAVRKPWIGMTRGFWKDKNRYLESYWNRFENIWIHGDFAAIDEDDLWFILGRSDDTIKVAGKRIGPAEVESILNSHPSVIESAVIGVPDVIKGESLVCFCVLQAHISAGDDLREALFNLITKELGKPLKPKEIKFSRALPKTRNAKVMHRIIRSVYLEKDTGDISAIEDKSTLDAIRSAW